MLCIMQPGKTKSKVRLLSERRGERADELLEDLFDLRRLEDEGRREQEMVAAHAVDRPAHRVARQPGIQCLRLEPGVDAPRRVERVLRGAVLHQLDAPEKATKAITRSAPRRRISRSNAFARRSA